MSQHVVRPLTEKEAAAGSTVIIHAGKFYTPGQTVEMEGDAAKALLESGLLQAPQADGAPTAGAPTGGGQGGNAPATTRK